MGTVLAPADIEVLPLGAQVDLTVSAGPARVASAFRLRALAPTLFRPNRSGTIATTVVASRPGVATIAFLDSHGHRLASWRRPLRTGLNQSRLRLPSPVRQMLIRRPGPYWLNWMATSGRDRATDRKRVLVVGSPTRRARPR